MIGTTPPMCVFVCSCLCFYVCVHLCVCMFVWVFVCSCLCFCVCVHLCVCVCRSWNMPPLCCRCHWAKGPHAVPGQFSEADIFTFSIREPAKCGEKKSHLVSAAAEDKKLQRCDRLLHIFRLQKSFRLHPKILFSAARHQPFPIAFARFASFSSFFISDRSSIHCPISTFSQITSSQNLIIISSKIYIILCQCI